METDYIKLFRDKYTYINDETLKKASAENPELLVGLINSSVRGTTKGYVIYNLAVGSREEYFDLIKSFVNDESPFVREGAFMGLHEYYDDDREKYEYLKDFFKESLKKEKGKGVREQIESILEWIEFYGDYD